MINEPTPKPEGWTYLLNSRVNHYFVNGVSLCGKWMSGTKVFEQADDDPENCAGCKRKLKKRREKEAR